MPEVELHIQENRRNSDPVLDLKNFALRAIPDATFELAHLRQLSLTNNDLSQLDPRLLELKHLEVLGLNYNRLAALPPWIGGMKSLRSLDCWNNQIEALPIEIREMERLEYLTLGFNRLNAIPRELFDFLSRLKALDLQSNPFDDMPSIRDMEIFDLMTFFRNETAYFGVIEVPKELSVAFQQFFTFFPEYVERVTGSRFELDVSRTQHGIKLTTHATADLDIDAINRHFQEYFRSLSLSPGGTEALALADNVEARILKLELNLQVQHLKSQLEIFQFQNKYLKGFVDKLLHHQDLLARNPTPLTIAIHNRQNNDTEDLLRQLRELVSENRDAESLYDDLAEEMRSDDPDRGRIEKLWGQLCEKAPPVAAVVAVVSKVLEQL